VQIKIVWNRSNFSITGYALSTYDMMSLHDVYEGINEEDSQKAVYVLWFPWRDISFNVEVTVMEFKDAPPKCLNAFVVSNS
uniref:Uncharacterized protein n=1 Tax=Amphimedon queenslandica TaxID=400682 RepID=A0A1X7VYN6_AMPQE